MQNIVQQIDGKECPVRPMDVCIASLDPVSYNYFKPTCSKDCAAFYEYHMDGRGGYCSEETAERTYQACRMWPGE